MFGNLFVESVSISSLAIMDLSQTALQAIGGLMDQKISQAMKPAMDRMMKIEENVGVLSAKVDNMDSRVAALESGAQPRSSMPGSSKDSTWKPSFIEIKGFCSFEERSTHGIDRTAALALTGRLKAALPAECANVLSDPIMLGVNKSYSIKVPVKDPQYIESIKAIWRTELRENHWVVGEHKMTLYPTVEPDPLTKRRNGTLGRVKAWAELKVSNDQVDSTVRTFWSPDFLVFLEPELGGAAVELAFVPEDGPVQWNMSGLAQLNLKTPQEAKIGQSRAGVPQPIASLMGPQG